MNSETTSAARGDYRISTDPSRLDLVAIHGYLTRSYWSPGISRELVARAAAHSLCFGLYHRAAAAGGDAGREHVRDAQVGYARVITDRATFAYLCDVYVLEEHRGHGLGVWLMEVVTAHPDLQGLRRFVLITRDAHGLYAKFGFTPLVRPEGYMEVHRTGLYGGAPPA